MYTVQIISIKKIIEYDYVQTRKNAHRSWCCCYCILQMIPTGFIPVKNVSQWVFIKLKAYVEFDWVDCLFSKTRSQQTDFALINWFSVWEILLYYLHTRKDLIFNSL